MQTITTFDSTAEGWERSLYTFLAEKELRSGSRRTVEGYGRKLLAVIPEGPVRYSSASDGMHGGTRTCGGRSYSAH